MAVRHLLAYVEYKEEWFDWEKHIIQRALTEMLDDNTH